jgi:hypothetical protein
MLSDQEKNQPPLTMRTLLKYLPAVAVLVFSAGFVAACTAQKASLPAITVYKSPTCGCCSKWVDHLKANGFEVEATDMPDVTPMKTRLGLPAGLASCHTAVVGGYVVEGHVPADVIKKLLEEKPAVAGIAVPGMPIGSPGMEGPNPQPYDVIAFTKDGEKQVFASVTQ